MQQENKTEPKSEFAVQLVASEEVCEQYATEISSRLAEAESSLKGGLPPDEALKTKAFQAAATSANFILKFIPALFRSQARGG
ncbi:MAG: hypothetical protein OXC81_03185 [Betaproteobacteria bacterium]|nr:hypothetical protein [Betaproteobacteria bacterium]